MILPLFESKTKQVREQWLLKSLTLMDICCPIPVTILISSPSMCKLGKDTSSLQKVQNNFITISANTKTDLWVSCLTLINRRGPPRAIDISMVNMNSAFSHAWNVNKEKWSDWSEQTKIISNAICFCIRQRDRATALGLWKWFLLIQNC